MIDRAALFLELTNRNRLRLRGGLPSLDIRREYEFRIALDQERTQQNDCSNLYAADRELIEIQVIADLDAKMGNGYRHSPDGITAITLTTQQRFREFLREVHGIATRA